MGKVIHLKEIFVKNCEKTPKEPISIISTLRKLIITKHFGKLSLHSFLTNSQKARKSIWQGGIKPFQMTMNYAEFLIIFSWKQLMSLKFQIFETKLGNIYDPLIEALKYLENHPSITNIKSKRLMEILRLEILVLGKLLNLSKPWM